MQLYRWLFERVWMIKCVRMCVDNGVWCECQEVVSVSIQTGMEQCDKLMCGGPGWGIVDGIARCGL